LCWQFGFVSFRREIIDAKAACKMLMKLTPEERRREEIRQLEEALRRQEAEERKKLEEDKKREEERKKDLMKF